MKDKILSFLKESDDFISGQKISEHFGVSRTSVWKQIKSLKEDGYEIESVSNKGYRLISSPDILNYQEVRPYLKTKYIGRNFLHFDSLNSTNVYGMEMAPSLAEGSLVLAEKQDSGKGRLGRGWLSPYRKGIYFSLILKPDIEPNKISSLSLVAAAAVFSALKEEGLDLQIKWPNDLVVGEEKIAGILTEMSGELGDIYNVVLGIGINANLDQKDLPEDRPATSLKILLEKKVNRKEILGKVLNYLEIYYEEFAKKGNLEETLRICRENSSIIGKEIEVFFGGKSKKAKALSLNQDGSLAVDFGNKIENIYSGEVSLTSLD